MVVMLDAPTFKEAPSFDAPATRLRSRRRSLRRAVTLDCKLESDVWDGSVVLSATDLSTEGLWVETPYALHEGEELVVSFELPGTREFGRVWAIAEVARVGLFRRRGEEQPSGMGLVFTYCSEDDRVRLRAALQGLPPPLPTSERRISVPPPLPLPNVSATDGCASHDVFDDSALPAVLDWLLASD
jgi:hypothetical protein